MSPEWGAVVGTFEARQLLMDRLTQVEEPGYWKLIGALAFLFRRATSHPSVPSNLTHASALVAGIETRK